MKWTVRHDAEFIVNDPACVGKKLSSTITNFSFVRCFVSANTSELAFELWLNHSTMTAVPLIRCKEGEYRRHLFAIVGNNFPGADMLIDYARRSLVPVGVDVDFVLPEGDGVCMFVYYYSRPLHYENSKTSPDIPDFLGSIGITADTDPHFRAGGYTYPCVTAGGYDWSRFCQDAIYTIPLPRASKRSRDSDGGMVTAYLRSCAQKRPAAHAVSHDPPHASVAAFLASSAVPVAADTVEEPQEPQCAEEAVESAESEYSDESEESKMEETGVIVGEYDDESEMHSEPDVLGSTAFDLCSDIGNPLELFFDPCATVGQILGANCALSMCPALESQSPVPDDQCGQDDFPGDEMYNVALEFDPAEFFFAIDRTL